MWQEDLHPGAAARAQILPALEEERKRLEKQLAEVSSFRVVGRGEREKRLTEMQLDMSNRELQATMQSNVKARDAADEDVRRLLDLLEEVRTFHLVRMHDSSTKVKCVPCTGVREVGGRPNGGHSILDTPNRRVYQPRRSAISHSKVPGPTSTSVFVSIKV